MDSTQFANTDPHNTTLYLQGKRLAVKSAVVGSIVFAFIDLVVAYINSLLVEHISVSLNNEGILLNICLTIFIILLGCALAYFPASLLGGFLAKLLEKDANKHMLS